MIDSALAISSAVSGVQIVGLYLWYAWAFTRLFPKLGVEGWKGWVPVLNEIVLLQRGGVAGWSVVFYVLPIVQLYGIYLRVLALHRIGQLFGKGSGVTVLGVLVPPAWATLLAGSRMPAEGDYDRRVYQLMRPNDPVAPAVYAAEPAAPRPAPVAQAFPSLAPATPEPVIEAAPVLPPAEIAPPSRPGTILFPWASAEPDPAPAHLSRPKATAPVVAPTTALVAPPGVDDELDRTIVVERRPFVPWRLVTDDGHVFPLRARRVLLGRMPVASTDDVAVVAVPDGTKTLSKNHARLELSAEGSWSITDLDSTNGVVIVERDGSETLLPPGGSAPVPGRFLLGRVGMQLSAVDIEATR